MSISGLSYGVVRTEEADSITSLTLQDVGLVMPGGRSGNLLIQGGRKLGGNYVVQGLGGQSSCVRVKLVGLPYQVKAYVVSHLALGLS